MLASRLKWLLPRPLWKLLRRLLVERRLPPVVRLVLADRLSFLGERALAELHECAAAAEAKGIPGLFIEAGCALGGSALVIADAKAPGRTFRIYDVFGMPPGPSEGDGPDVEERWREIAGGRSPGIGEDIYYGYVDDLLDRVLATFRRYGWEPGRGGIEFVPGLLQERLAVDGPVALAHIDCDRYASVRTCLERIAPALPPGGVMVIDDYDSKSGCRLAVDQFLDANGGTFRLVRRSRVHIVRR